MDEANTSQPHRLLRPGSERHGEECACGQQKLPTLFLAHGASHTDEAVESLRLNDRSGSQAAIGIGFR